MAFGEGIFTLKEFQGRGVIKLAPDAVVYIGGSTEIQVIAPVTNGQGKLSFNDGITNISVQNNIDPPGSSTANIEVATPIYGEKSKYWVPFLTPEGDLVRYPLFVPMMEVKIYYKGRFLVNGRPKYYPAFWGLVTNVEENYSGGMWKISLQCVDVLHWWAYSRINIHPVPADNIAAGGGLKITAYATIFEKHNPFSIIYNLARGLGMHEFVTPTWVAQLTPSQTIYPNNLYQRVTSGIMSAWAIRLGNQANLLKMYGAQGGKVDANGKTMPLANNERRTDSDTTLNAQAEKNSHIYGIDNEMLQNFTVFFEFDKMGDFSAAEYSTKLDIATEVKTRSEYEFYQDVNGNFIFKPPFYNIDVKSMQPYVIKPIDIISSSFSQDTEAIITVLQLFTSLHPQVRHTSYARGSGFHMDIDKAKRYGIRYHEENMEYISDRTIARSLALAKMNQINAKTFSGNVTIPGRPEIKLGYPIYISHRDSYHYPKSITHSFDFGGSFTTVIAFETERKRKYEFKGNEWGDIQKSLCYVFEEGLLPEPPNKDAPQVYDNTKAEQVMAELQKSNSQVVSIPQGRYKLAPISEILPSYPGKSAKFFYGVTSNTVPFTDENGYEIVGAMPYGRGLSAVRIGSKAEDVVPTTEKNPTEIKTPRTGADEESLGMEGLFFNNVTNVSKGEEGAVPFYLDTAGTHALTSGYQSDPAKTPLSNIDSSNVAGYSSSITNYPGPTGIQGPITDTVATNISPKRQKSSGSGGYQRIVTPPPEKTVVANAKLEVGSESWQRKTP